MLLSTNELMFQFSSNSTLDNIQKIILDYIKVSHLHYLGFWAGGCEGQEQNELRCEPKRVHQ